MEKEEDGMYSFQSLDKEQFPFPTLYQQKEDHHQITDYLQFYKLDVSNLQYEFGFFDHCSQSFFMQRFRPENKRGTIVVLHGYYDHSATLKHAIRYFTNMKYEVICYDLQGHGLSTGEKATIKEFSQYREAFSHFIHTYCQKGSPPFVVAHSTGAGVVVDYLLKDSHACPFKHVFFLAPLVRMKGWQLAALFIPLLFPYVKSFKRVFRRNSSDKAYLKEVRRDPLQFTKLPLEWIKAVQVWTHTLDNTCASTQDVTFIQGNKDKTVLHRYNLPFLQKKFPNFSCIIVDGGDHQLLNEKEIFRNIVLQKIEKVVQTKEKE
jgi:alpha-beta hydrolase superfamily lysophospholipase